MPVGRGEGVFNWQGMHFSDSLDIQKPCFLYFTSCGTFSYFQVVALFLIFQQLAPHRHGITSCRHSSSKLVQVGGGGGDG